LALDSDSSRVFQQVLSPATYLRNLFDWLTRIHLSTPLGHSWLYPVGHSWLYPAGLLITDRPGRRTDALGRPGANARTIAFAIVVVLAQACAAVPPAATVAAPAAALPPLQPVLIASELAVGEQRVPIGILDRNTPVNDATVHLRAYRQSATDPLLSESDAPFKGEGLQGKGAYVGHLRFSTVGLWHLEVTIRQGSRTPTTAQLQVNVLARSGPPAVGDAAPRSQNPTIRDVAQVEDLDYPAMTAAAIVRGSGSSLPVVRRPENRAEPLPRPR